MSKPNSIQFANAIEQVKHELPLHLEKQRIKANLYMNMYKALKKEGFTDEQAMEIIKARGYESNYHATFGVTNRVIMVIGNPIPLPLLEPLIIGWLK